MFVILTVCLLSSPHICKEQRVEQSIEERPPISCIVEGQSTIATWQQEHPAWRIDSWKCVPRSRLDQSL
jgi:hypothetical protein